jgi:tRNA(fMet)-specific endonuclease VapC
MIYLLDTNAVIAILKGHPGFHARLAMCRVADFGVPSIVLHELYFGSYKSERTTENLARVDALRFPIVDFGRDDTNRAGELRAALASAGTPIGPYDALIAGQASTRSLILITRNQREFQRISGLKTEDWEQ